MSTFSSICWHKDHNDKIDVAHCFVTDKIRLIVWEDEDGPQRNVYLTPDEVLHLHHLLTKAITKVTI